MMPTKTLLAAAFAAIAVGTVADAQARQDRPQRRNQQRQRDDGGLKVGQIAPTFELKSVDGSATFTLKEFRGEKPVILFFGSYT